MGIAKHRMEEKESNWDSLAASKGWRCKNCTELIPYGEGVVFFDTGHCAYCEHMLEKLRQD